MTNSSDTYKTGEKADRTGDFICVNCSRSGKATTIHVEEAEIFPHCGTCESKDATYRLAGTVVGN